jgi:hypothetical protein
LPAWPATPLPIGGRTGSRPLQGVTIAITDRFATFELDTDVHDAYERAQQAVQALGARLLELPAPVKAFDLNSEEFAAVLVEMWSYHQSLAEHEQAYRPYVRELLVHARTAMTASDYARIQLRRAGLALRWDNWFDANGVDLILEPTTRVVAYPRGHGYDYTDHNPLADMTLGWNVRDWTAHRHPTHRAPRTRGDCDPGSHRSTGTRAAAAALAGPRPPRLAARNEPGHIDPCEQPVGDADTRIRSLHHCRLMQVDTCLSKHLVSQRAIAGRVRKARQAMATDAPRKGQHRVGLLARVRLTLALVLLAWQQMATRGCRRRECG